MTTLNTLTTKLAQSFTQQIALFAAAAILLSNSATSFATPITSDLAVWYDARFGSGTSMPDQSGNGNTGTVIPGATFANESGLGTGFGNDTRQVLLLDDALTSNAERYITGSDGINGDQGDLGDSLTGITAEALIRFERTGSQKLVSIAGGSGIKSGGTQNRFIELQSRGSDDGNTLRFYVRLGTPAGDNWFFVESNAAHPDDEWMHVVGVFNAADEANTLKLYVNGIQQTDELISALALNPHASGIPTSSGGIDISGGSDEELQGAFGFLRVYDRGLTAAEVALNFADAQEFFNAAPVPEPSAGLLLMLGALCIVRKRRRRERHSN